MLQKNGLGLDSIQCILSPADFTRFLETKKGRNVSTLRPWFEREKLLGWYREAIQYRGVIGVEVLGHGVMQAFDTPLLGALRIVVKNVEAWALHNIDAIAPDYKHFTGDMAGFGGGEIAH